MTLCPKQKSSSKDCRAPFCPYRGTKGACTLDFEPEDKEYQIGFIADTLQTSRQRVWRLYDIAIAKLQSRLSDT